MTTPQSKNILLFLLSSVGLIVLPHATNIPILLFCFFYLLLAWRFVCVWQPHYLPKSQLLFVLTLFGFALLLSQHTHSRLLGRDAGTELFIVALGLKLLETRSERDFYLVTFLAFIVAASLFLYQQSLFMAAYILAVCCVLFATLVAINSIQVHPFAALKTASIIVLQAIPMAVVIFILFPRVEAPRWMIFQEKNKAKIGLSDSMEPGSISELSTSDELVFRVQFTAEIPPPKARYWRGPVLSYTDGKRWTQLNSQRFVRSLDQPTFAGTPYQYTLLMEAQEKNWVFALDLPAQFSAPLERNGHYQLINPENANKRAEYQITSYPLYNTGNLTSLEYQDSTQLPREPSERVKQLVTQLHGFENQPELFIGELLRYFKTQDFHYTLTPPLMEENPIESFLFDKRRGFCSHYASAFVYLMRVAGIPARVVTGYQGGKLNTVGNFLEIRQANAHAWAEVWLNQKGWLRVDPTEAVAPERIEQQIDLDLLQLGGEIRFNPKKGNWLEQTRQLWNSVDYQWQRWVVNYDSINQSDFLSTFGIHDMKTMLRWLMILIAVITVLLSGLLLYQKQKKLDPVLLLYLRFCKKLEPAGLIRFNREGASDFAERAKRALPDQADAIARITAIFIRLRYGKKANRDDLARLARLVALFKVSR
jgi:protein-glutamine gamma-glutamyltransferase